MLGKFDKLRGRPFMLIKFVFFPGKNFNTSMKNWKEKKDWLVKEEINFVDNVQDKHLLYYDIILDVHRAVLIKNKYENEYSPGEVIKYLYEKYGEHIQRANNVWRAKMEQNAKGPILNLSP